MKRLVRRALRNRHLLLLDALLLPAATLLAYVIRFEGLDWGMDQQHGAVVYILTSLPIKLSICFSLGLYQRLWRYASVVELERLLLAVAGAGASCFLLGALVLPGLQWTEGRVPLSILIMDGFLMAAVLAFPRLLLRIAGHRLQPPPLDDARRVLIAGAGSAGGMIVNELQANPQLGLNPVGFVDDDVTKHHHRMFDLPVFASLAEIRRVIRQHDVQEIIIAMPTAPGTVVREVVRVAAEAKVTTRIVPGIFDIISGKLEVTSLRQVEIQDLLRRESVETNLDLVRTLATGETVLVTGAGGSIGSELCRQLARLGPARIVLLGHGENSIFDVLHELDAHFPSVRFEAVIADIRDREHMARIFARYRPYTVFHTAAHKHVPLMETNVAEAVTNNILGTKNVVELSAEGRVEHLVLISTDKAVRPTSIMGATKRVAEQIVQHTAEEMGRNFVAVRFGNVLGSRGSVVPTFLRQIAEGGPVTVTHPEMRRYFMTIPESVQLVLQAGALGRGGEVFVLDMG
ncbi:MAG: SDR family NAD(P)-dependent oxidoreductase, partial [Gemmatimonadales bacterium]